MMLCLSFAAITSGQNLEGEWKGYFTNNLLKTYITLSFTKQADGNWQVFSYTSLPDINGRSSGDLMVCQMSCRLSGDSVYLAETKRIAGPAPVHNCFQKMQLKLRRHKKYTDLDGWWSTADEACQDAGEIFFSRRW